MKKILLSIIAAGTVVTSQAQAPKEGSILIYGNVGLSFYKNDYDPGQAGNTTATRLKANTFSINPGIGYQFNPNWTVGLNFGYTTFKQDSSGSDLLKPLPNNWAVRKNRDLNIGAFIRYTKNLNKTFFFYEQLNLNYLNGRQLYQNTLSMPDSQNVYQGFGANWYPAFGVSLNDMVALNFNFGGIAYASKKWDLDASPAIYTERGFDFTFGHQVNVGVSVNLGGRHGKHCCGGHMEPGDDMRHNGKDSKKEKDEDEDDDK